MKHFNTSKINHSLIGRVERIIRIIRLILTPVHRRVAHGRPAILLVDGFLIGDAVLLRPLLRAIIERYGKTHDILVVSGRHARHIYADMLPDIRIIEFQFPWATYDYSLRKLVQLGAIWLRLFTTRVEVALEARGDFRSIAWTSLACPARLIGFDFTGGAALLTDVVPDDGTIAHLFEHARRLGGVLNLEFAEEHIRMDLPTHPKGETARIGVSFAGSQPLKQLPREVGLALLRQLATDVDAAELWYIQAPQETVYTDEVLERELGGRLRLFRGNFEQYYAFLQTLDCHIGMDSGGGHLCAMFGIPTVVIFGTQVPFYCRPMGGHPLFCAESALALACRPCDGITCVYETYQKCLLDIDRHTIVQFVRESLRR